MPSKLLLDHSILNKTENKNFKEILLHLIITIITGFQATDSGKALVHTPATVHLR